MPYYTMLVRFDGKGLWCIEFGDYDLGVVTDEADEYTYNGHKVKIIKTLDADQEAIEARVLELNKAIQ